jgi:hypothetical protein
MISVDIVYRGRIRATVQRRCSKAVEGRIRATARRWREG